MKGRGLVRRTGNTGQAVLRANRLSRHLDRSLPTRQLVGNLTAASERRPSVGGKLSREGIGWRTEM